MARMFGRTFACYIFLSFALIMTNLFAIIFPIRSDSSENVVEYATATVKVGDLNGGKTPFPSVFTLHVVTIMSMVVVVVVVVGFGNDSGESFVAVWLGSSLTCVGGKHSTKSRNDKQKT